MDYLFTAASKGIRMTPVDAEFVTNENFTSKVYQDEPIPITDEQIENRIPPEYRVMKKIAITMSSYHEPAEKIFYKQGKFMEYFEDDYDYGDEFIQYFPTYRSMNNHELRGYFSWRTKVRRGVIEKTSLSFVFIYIYELINRIGVRSTEEGFHALKNFWTAYKEIDSGINRYVKLWLKDYVVYNNLDKSLLEGLLDTNFNNAVMTLLNHKSHNADEVFSALSSLSPYNMESSRFFKQYPDDVKSVTCAVFSALSDYYEKNCKNTLCEKFFGKIYTYSYLMFSSAVFYNQIRQKDFVYEINDLCKYTCKNGNWSCKSFFPYGGKNRQIGALLKTIDFTMRQMYNYKSALKVVEPTKTLQGLISKAIDKYKENQREAAGLRIEIDVSRLQNIRKAALETQGKLLVEELEEADVPECFDKKEAPENHAGLSDTEYLFMKCLLYGRAYTDLVQSKGVPLSVLVDAVNEKLFDRFDDTVIVDTGYRPELIPDYVEGLKEIIRE
ncbi:MAG: TerB N-terminal domain-containing protein [Acidobacteria bacterium]|nr:TerB N-terminal domain-containing protein [Acidobacteriota bacterium]